MTAERSGTYILDAESNPQAVDAITWADNLTSPNRQLARDEIGELTVSTVFGGVDLNFERVGPPILWETRVFGLPDAADEICLQYSSKADALEGHKWTCDEIRLLFGDNT